LIADGFTVNLHYSPVYRQTYYERMGFKSGYCPAAERYFTETISLPIFPSLATTDQDRVIAALTKVMM
jgi:dTDP-4-amino-4,6-dideoxygalactose transaminase